MTAEPRDVEEIRADIALWAVHPFGAYPTHEQHCARERLLADVEPLLDRLAAADRENAELRGELRASTETGIKSARVTIDLLRERDDLTSQLAAAQAQLAEANGRAKALQGVIDRCTAHIRQGMQLADDERDAGLEALVVGWTKYHGDQCAFKARADAAEARLEAVQALHRSDGYAWSTCRGCGREWPCPTDEAIQAAALSAAPQPEPDVRAENLRRLRQRPCCRDHADATPEPPASDEPARCEHGKTTSHWMDDWGLGLGAVKCPGPAASGTPDGGS